MFNSLCFLRMSELDWVAALTAAFSVLKSSRFLGGMSVCGIALRLSVKFVLCGLVPAVPEPGMMRPGSFLYCESRRFSLGNV